MRKYGGVGERVASDVEKYLTRISQVSAGSEPVPAGQGGTWDVAKLGTTLWEVKVEGRRR